MVKDKNLALIIKNLKANEVDAIMEFLHEFRVRQERDAKKRDGDT